MDALRVLDSEFSVPNDLCLYVITGLCGSTIQDCTVSQYHSIIREPSAETDNFLIKSLTPYLTICEQHC